MDSLSAKWRRVGQERLQVFVRTPPRGAGVADGGVCLARRGPLEALTHLLPKGHPADHVRAGKGLWGLRSVGLTPLIAVYRAASY